MNRKSYGDYSIDILQQELVEHGYSLEKYSKLSIPDRNKIILKWWKCFNQTAPDNRFNLDFHLTVIVPKKKQKFFNYLQNSKFDKLLKD